MLGNEMGRAESELAMPFLISAPESIGTGPCAGFNSRPAAAADLRIDSQEKS